MGNHLGVLRNSTLTIEATDYSAKVRKVRFVPTTSSTTYRTLVPDGAMTDVDSPTWAVELQGVQDWMTGGIARYLLDNHGTLATFVFTPKNGTGNRKVTAEVMCMAVPFGGEEGQFADFDVTLPVDGEPAWSDVSA